MIKLLIALLPFFLLTCAVLPETARADSENSNITLLLTANLNGRFLTTAEDQDRNDPMLIMAQSLIAEQKKRPIDLFLDLGNAFYPGVLSRFSFGAVMMDYLHGLGCGATLISSQDLKIDIGNLEFIQNGKQTVLLSADIRKNEMPVFTPYFIQHIKGKTFAFIGISSKKGFLDVAETELHGVSLVQADEALDSIIAEVEQEKVDHIVLLSGRSTSDNLVLMEKHRTISLCISGGDTFGEIYSAKTSRIDLDSGRSLVTLTNPDRYYVLSLTAKGAIHVDSLESFLPSFHPTTDPRYVEFVQRATLWKQRFAVEGEEKIADSLQQTIAIDDRKVANLLRDRFRAEIAMVDSNSIIPRAISKEVTYSDIIGMVRNMSPIFTFKLTGKELKRVVGNAKGLVVTGTDGITVQRHPIEKDRKYLVCATQLVYDRVKRELDREVPYKNSWRTLSDELLDDLKGKRVISGEDFTYLDDRFRMLMEIQLSNFYDHSTISGGDNPDIPPGMPTGTYHKWGIEDTVDLIVYNQNHKIILTPYIYYIRQDDDYLKNLLRMTFFYTYNIGPHLKPYFKTQMDTVVVEAKGQRPLLFRNTAGAFFETTHIDGKVGIGFEKQSQDPEKPLYAGIETILDARHDILKHLEYRFHLDSFYSLEQLDTGRQQFSANITNAFSFKLNSFAAFSIRHRWYYYSSLENPDEYQDSQILMSLDVNTGFKLYGKGVQ